jgi:FkbM family methyltransferase
MDISCYRTQLDALLSADVSSLVSRQESRFREAIAPTGETYVLFGADRLGRIALAGLRRAGIQPIAFADNNPLLWNTSVDDLLVLSPDDAARRFRAKAVFVVTVYTGNTVSRQLEALNLKAIPFALLAWNHPTAMLPHGAVELPQRMYDQAEDVRRALSLWSDDTSCLEYLAQLQWRTSLDASVLPPHLPKEQTYYLEDLVTLSPNETFVDCGAFDGDSVRNFLDRQGIAFNRIAAIEPDSATYQRLVAYTDGLAPEVRNRVTTIPKAIGAHAGMVRFDATGTAASALGQGSLTVESLPLDEMLGGFTPSYIKVDVEGAEPDVLRGARDVIKRHRPVLAVCLYHKQEHLWQIPLLLQSLTTDYRLFLRRYSDDCWELVGYAVPEERARSGAAGSGGEA